MAPFAYGTHFSKKNLLTDYDKLRQSDHAGCMPCLECEQPNLLKESMPPDPDFEDLIEWAFIEG